MKKLIFVLLSFLIYNLTNAQEVIFTEKLKTISEKKGLVVLNGFGASKKRIQIQKEFFQNIGIWEKIKFNVANSPNVRAALSFVSRGDLEYGVVYKSDALVDKKVKIIYELDPSLYTKVQYPITILNKREDTLLLYSFLKQKKAISVFKKWGFIVNHD